jgi:hypothetical protein
MAVYASLAYSGVSRTLYSTVHFRLSSPWRNVFFGLAALAFFVCLYQGAAAMLTVLPNSWGHADGSGEYVTIRAGLAGLFAIGVGLQLIGVVDRTTHDAFLIRELSEECGRLKNLVESSLDELRLQELRLECEEEITKIETAAKRHGRTDLSTAHLWPEGQRLVLYGELVGLVGRQQERLQRR